jgi:phosphoribosylformylglycinamidine cyclo-ligase
MPGFYAAGEYDVAGFIVGVVDRERLIDGSRLAPGDVLIGLPSSGLHTNGYSLARRIVFEELGLGATSRVEELGAAVGEVLLAPHRSYLRPIRPLLGSGSIKAMAHITGGGMTDNLPRALPETLSARISTAAWDVPPIFRWLQRSGRVPLEDMRRTFNMGIGLIVMVAPGDAAAVLAQLNDGAVIGELVQGRKSVEYV